MKLCVMFPGIGYHCDKPLLYYTGKLAAVRGFEVIRLRYSDFPEGAKGNEEKLRAAAAHALEQTEEQLRDVPFGDYEEIVFVGKSIGTAVCLAYRERHGIKARGILFTPLVMTFDHPAHDCTAFHGLADPWADTREIRELCDRDRVGLFEYEDANHSLETGEPERDIRILGEVIRFTGKEMDWHDL